MPKIPGQKASHNDLTKDTIKEIMKDVKRAWASDHCTEAAKDKKK